MGFLPLRFEPVAPGSMRGAPFEVNGYIASSNPAVFEDLFPALSAATLKIYWRLPAYHVSGGRNFIDEPIEFFSLACARNAAIRTKGTALIVLASLDSTAPGLIV